MLHTASIIEALRDEGSSAVGTRISGLVDHPMLAGLLDAGQKKAAGGLLEARYAFGGLPRTLPASQDGKR